MEILKIKIRNKVDGNNINGFIGQTATHVTVKLDSLLDENDLNAFGDRCAQLKKNNLYLFGITIIGKGARRHITFATGDGLSLETVPDIHITGGVSVCKGSIIPQLWWHCTPAPALAQEDMEIEAEMGEGGDDEDGISSDDSESAADTGGVYDINLKEQQLYSERSVRNYVSSMTDSTQTLIQHIESTCASSHRPPVLAMQVARNIISIIENHFNVSTSGAQQETEEQTLDFKMIESAKQFLSDIKTNGTKRKQEHLASNIICNALFINTVDISKRKFANRLGINRKMKLIADIDSLFDTILPNDILHDVYSTESESDDDDDYIPTHADGHGSDSNFSDDSSSGDDSRGGSCENLKRKRDQQPKKRLSTKSLTTLDANRKTRKDQVNLDSAFHFWHAQCQLDTNAKRIVFVVDPSGNELYHKTSIQSQSTKIIHKKYMQSLEYQQHLQQYPDQTIGRRKFSHAKCPCILNQKFHDCADVLKVGLNCLLDALRRIRQQSGNEFKNCTCLAHSDPKFGRCHESTDAFLEYLLCEKETYVDLQRQVEQVDLEAAKIHQSDQFHQKKIKADNHWLKPATTSGAFKVKMTSALPCGWSGVLKIHNKICADINCQDCGLERLTAHKCLVEWSKTKNIKYKKFMDMPRGSGGVAKELVEVTTSCYEFMVELIRQSQKAIPHLWNEQWDAHHRNTLLSQGLDQENIVLHFDFSAVLDIKPQHCVTCPILEHCIQEVFIVSHSPRLFTTKSGYVKTITTNDAFHCWGKNAEGELKSNVHFHNHCLDFIITHYKRLFAAKGKILKRVDNLSDGCGEQYKSRKNAYHLSTLCKRHSLDEVVHTFAPTSCFKCCCDSAGDDTKIFIREGEKNEAFRCQDAYDVYKVCRDKMLQPGPISDEKKHLMGIDSRSHVYLVDAKRASGVDIADPNIILTNYAVEEINAKEIPGIQSIHQIRGTRQGLLYFRSNACWCSQCRSSNYEQCLSKEIIGGWIEKKSTKIPVVKAQLTQLKWLSNFYKGAVLPHAPVIIAFKIVNERNDVADASNIKFALLNKQPAVVTKTVPINPQRVGVQFEVAEKDDCVEILILTRIGRRNAYYVHDNTKSQLIPLKCLIAPPQDYLKDKFAYIKCIMTSVSKETDITIATRFVTVHTYTIDNQSIDDLVRQINI